MNRPRTRRRMLGQLLAAVGASLLPAGLYASIRSAFAAPDAETAIRELIGDLPLEESDRIQFYKLPDIAEDGSAVSVGIRTDIPDVQRVIIIIDNNPNPLSAVFDFTPEVPIDFVTRVKMGESSRVRGIALAPGRAYMVSKEVKVTLGGCGG